ncbi:hypothetical protein ACFFHM_05675 [Halalkalibacter kiskunsagensis]|uniref:Uncharacterized protein n=1 Tax=Halalkalibacter kiskunsagensis TaxID=1548599 RepID=A0ABV6KAS1_9BACI
MKSHQPIVINRPVKNKKKLTMNNSNNEVASSKGYFKKKTKVKGGCCLKGKLS